MLKRLIVGEAAEDELRRSASWYEERKAGLGVDLNEAVRAAFRQLREHPTLGGLQPHVPKELGVRRLLVDRFPYAVVYRDDPTEIRILAIAHTKRRPGYWRSRDEVL